MTGLRRFWNKCFVTAVCLVLVIVFSKLIKHNGDAVTLDLPSSAHASPKFVQLPQSLESASAAARSEEAKVVKKADQSDFSPIDSTFPSADFVRDYLQDVLQMSLEPTESDSSDLCPFPPPGLAGPMNPNLTIPTDEELVSRYKNVREGGYWKPSNCTARWKIAILVPFRKRDQQLRVFLNVFHEFLQKQMIEYRIFILEQTGTTKFNRAMLFNVGFLKVLEMIVPNFDFGDMTSTIDYLIYKNTGNDSFSKGSKHQKRAKNWLSKASQSFDCFFFHDVDMLPLDDRNIYSCTRAPRHVGHDVPKWSWLEECLYGAFSMTMEQFLSVNGLSNKFAGWGGEDNDLYYRLTQFWSIGTYPSEIGAYKMFEEVDHVSEKQSPASERLEYINTWRSRWTKDGLNSLKTNCPYEVLVATEPLLTRISIDFQQERC